MTNTDSRVTIHMAASLDGFIARRDGSVDWLETSDQFADGDTMDPIFDSAVDAHFHEGTFKIRDSNTVESTFVVHAGGEAQPEGSSVLTRRSQWRAAPSPALREAFRASSLSLDRQPGQQ